MSHEHHDRVVLPTTAATSPDCNFGEGAAVSQASHLPHGLAYSFLYDRDFHRLLPRTELLDHNHPNNQQLLAILESMTASQQEHDLFRFVMGTPFLNFVCVTHPERGCLVPLFNKQTLQPRQLSAVWRLARDVRQPHQV